MAKGHPGTHGPLPMATSDDETGRITRGEISTTGEAEYTPGEIEVIPAKNMAAVMEDEKFMNEFVIVEIDLDEEPNSAIFIPVGHQGVMQYIKRGEPQRIRRKFLYSLIQGKRTSFNCSFGKDANGEAFNRLPGTQRTTFRIQLHEDTPVGRKKFIEWSQMP